MLVDCGWPAVSGKSADVGGRDLPQAAFNGEAVPSVDRVAADMKERA